MKNSDVDEDDNHEISYHKIFEILFISLIFYDRTLRQYTCRLKITTSFAAE